MKVPYKFTAPPPGWIDRFPDGDYTVGRGADPRGKSDGASPSDIAANPKKKKISKASAKRRKPRPLTAAE